MSTQYYAYAIFGHPIDYPLRTKTTRPNPLFGKYKFDPDSGRKVYKLIEDIEHNKEYVHTWIKRFGIDSVNNGTPHDYGRRESEPVVIGKLLAEIEIGQGKESDSFISLTPKEQNLIIDKIKITLADLKIPYNPKKVKTYICGYCSY